MSSESMNFTIAAQDDFTAVMKQFIDALDKADKKSSGMFDSWNKFTSFFAQGYLAFQGIKGSINSVITPLENFAKSVLATGQVYQQLSFQMTALLGDADKSAEAFKTIDKVASNVAGSVQGVAQAYTSMTAAGIANEKNMYGLAGVATIFGMRLDVAGQQMQRFVAGGVGAADMLRERGVLAMMKIQAQEMGVTWEKMTQKQRADLAANFMGKYAEAGRIGITTWSGAVEGLSDKWDQFKRKVADAGFYSTAVAYVATLEDALIECFDSGVADDWAINVSAALMAIGKTAMYAAAFVKDFAIVVAGVFLQLITPIMMAYDGLMGFRAALKGNMREALEWGNKVWGEFGKGSKFVMDHANHIGEVETKWEKVEEKMAAYADMVKRYREKMAKMAKNKAGGLGETDPEAEKAAREAAKKLQAAYESLRESLLSNTEKINEAYEEGKATLKANLDAKLISQLDYNTQSDRLSKKHLEDLQKITDAEQEERQRVVDQFNQIKLSLSSEEAQAEAEFKSQEGLLRAMVIGEGITPEDVDEQIEKLRGWLKTKLADISQSKKDKAKQGDKDYKEFGWAEELVGRMAGVSESMREALVGPLIETKNMVIGTLSEIFVGMAQGTESADKVMRRSLGKLVGGIASLFGEMLIKLGAADLIFNLLHWNAAGAALAVLEIAAGGALIAFGNMLGSAISGPSGGPAAAGAGAGAGAGGYAPPESSIGPSVNRQSKIIVNVGEGVVIDPKSYTRKVLEGVNELFQDNARFEFVVA